MDNGIAVVYLWKKICTLRLEGLTISKCNKNFLYQLIWNLVCVLNDSPNMKGGIIKGGGNINGGGTAKPGIWKENIFWLWNWEKKEKKRSFLSTAKHVNEHILGLEEFLECHTWAWLASCGRLLVLGPAGAAGALAVGVGAPAAAAGGCPGGTGGTPIGGQPGNIPGAAKINN